MYAYDAMRDLGRGLYHIDGAWKRSPLRRRMTVMALASGGLVMHSVIRIVEMDLERLEALGRPAYILVPNRLHGSEAGWYAERYPDARLLVPARAADRLARAFAWL